MNHILMATMGHQNENRVGVAQPALNATLPLTRVQAAAQDDMTPRWGGKSESVE
jgi:hypothetical protein